MEIVMKLRRHHIYSFCELMEVIAEVKREGVEQAFAGRSKERGEAKRVLD